MQVEIKRDNGLIRIGVAEKVLFQGDFDEACAWITTRISFPDMNPVIKILRSPITIPILISPTRVVLNRREAGAFLDIPPFTVDMLEVKGLLTAVRASREPKYYSVATLLAYQYQRF
ncbi:MAG: hypothetical protein ISS87_02375 [Candidatus Pacebacteria bacterium]|nr:hypothetical protein [Candidatus Paceibacterota bacterium]